MNTDPISAGNARIREAAKLRQKKFRRDSGCVLIEGARLVADALTSGATIRDRFCTQAFQESECGKVICISSGLDCTTITDAAAEKLSDTQTPQGIFAVVEFAPKTLADVELGIDALVLVADGISDPGNLGTMVRSAAALGACCVVASGDSCDVLNPKCVRATMGAVFRIPIVADTALADAVGLLKSRGLCIAAAVAHEGQPPWHVDLERPTALLIGSEADGLSREALYLADELVRIPMHHGTESLNAAASAAALLYEAARQRTEGAPA
jgi:RNA methyltransferase, TrmH family